MLGLGDVYIVSAMAGCVVITLVGIIYGAFTWNSNNRKSQK